jgi:hypothetical protein
MQIAKWLRERLGGESADDTSAAHERDPETPVEDDDTRDDENDDDPSVYPLW